MNRGDHSEKIFLERSDRELWLATLSEACQMTQWQIHSFCLMANHFHLVLETPHGDLVPGMKWLLSTYTNRFNRKHKLFGHLFSGSQAQTIEDLPSCDWCLGSEQFHRELLQQMTSLPEHPYAGEEWQQTAEQKALRVLADELRRRGWSDADLDRRRKGDLEKLSIACRLRAETTMTLSWIARRLKMGSAGSLANCLRASRK
jgi:REP element-mobilizing transposase RayT